MRIAILGAGPAGLYLSYLLKRRRPGADVTVIEQNPANATFGFGVVFSDRALEFLRADDPETYDAITPQMESWNDITLAIKNERIVIDGIGFAAIGRLKLLQLLQERARAAGVALQFDRAVKSLDELGEADLVVGADGLNSLVRKTFADDFKPTIHLLNNRFAWFGTGRVFDTLTQTFRHTPIGDFNAHHYRYAPGRSTFIVEVDEAGITAGTSSSAMPRTPRISRSAPAHGWRWRTPSRWSARCTRAATTSSRRCPHTRPRGARWSRRSLRAPTPVPPGTRTSPRTWTSRRSTLR
jgi:2-polyprenyl-6-methoxyphenol hydroxylase-like FAD-dependent oxidoreductase